MSYPRVCVIGAGSLSTRRIYPNLGAAGAQLVGCCDLDQAKAERNAALWGGQAYRDWETMLSEQTPDGVIICIGPEQHPVLAQAVLQAGYPVYTEKPPAVSSADALATARVAKETGLLCVTAFKKRYTRAADRAKAFLAGFPTEDFVSLSLDYGCGRTREDGPRTWFLLDFAIHGIDLVSYLGGDVAEVFAFSKGPEAYAISIRFSSGAVGAVHLMTHRSATVPTEELELTCRGGNWMTVHNSSVWKITLGGKAAEWREPSTFTSSGDDGYDTGHLAELVDYVHALQEGRTTSRSSIDQSYRSMVLYEAIRDSARSGELSRVSYEEI